MNAIVAPIESVTLLEDRAVVTRRAKLDLEKGRARLSLENVAPVLADKTVAVRLEGDVALHDVRVKRVAKIVAETKPERIRALEDELRSLREALTSARAKWHAIEVEANGIETTEALATDEIAEDTAWGRLDVEAWTKDLESLSTREDRVRAELVEASAAMRELERQIADKHTHLAQLRSPGSALAASIEIDLESPADASVELVVSYVVPAACWRPEHVATALREEPARVRFECQAVVWQNTGEDWNGVEVLLSTERPSLGADPPRLDSDVLAVTRKNPAIVIESRERTIEEAGLGAGAAPPRTGLPGIDDGGEARRIPARGKHTIPSDGRPHRLPLFSFESAAKRELVSMPELREAVFERTELVNEAALPILAGPVDLVKSGGPYGKTSVLYVAPGEKLELGWGPDPSLVVLRTALPLPDESTLLGSWTTNTEDVLVRISNLGAEPKRLTVKERVPVSEIEKVVIQVLEKDTTDQKRPDKNGFVEWKIEIAGHGRARIKLRTSTKKHSDVVG